MGWAVALRSKLRLVYTAARDEKNGCSLFFMGFMIEIRRSGNMQQGVEGIWEISFLVYEGEEDD
jgi:hypothetical protein